MPDPKRQDPDTQPNPAPSNPYRKDPTKPVGRDSDATPGKGTEPTRTPTRTDPQQQESAKPPTPRDWSGKVPPTKTEAGGAEPDPFKIG
jgi:hypothetical protein